MTREADAPDEPDDTEPASASIWSLSFDAFIQELFRRGYHRELKGTRQGNGWIKGYRSRMFTFTRYVKAFGIYHPERVVAPWKPLEAWNLTTVAIDRMKGWTLMDLHRSDVKDLFMTAWEQARYLPESNPVKYALWRADTMTKHTFGGDPKEGGERSPQYQRFLRMCFWLQYTVGDKEPIALPVVKIAELMGTDPKMVSIWRQKATAENWIRLVTEHSRRRKRATEFKVPDGPFDQFKGFVKGWQA